MAYNILYQGTLYSERQGSYVVNILVDAPVAGVGTIDISDLKISYDGDGRDLIGDVLQPSACTLGLNVTQGSQLDTFLNNIIGNENEYFIEVLRNGSRDWIGKVLLDVSEVEDAPFYTYEFTAVCGLGQLNDYNFDFALDSGNGPYLILGEVLRKALLPTFTHEQYTSTTPYIASAVNVYEEGQLGWVDTLCSLQKSRIARVSLIKDVAENEPLTCAEVIEKILKPFGVRLRMQNGCWHIIPPTAYINSSFRIFYYGNRDYSTGPLSTTLIGHGTNIESANNLNTLAGNNFTYKPALIRVDVNYQPKSSFVLQKEYNSSAYYPNFDVKNLDVYPVQIAGKVRYEIPRIFNGATNTLNGTVRMTFNVTASAGATSKYRLTWSQQLGFYWVTNLNAVCIYDFPNPTDSRAVNEEEFKLLIPVLVDTSITNLSFEIFVVNLAVTCGQSIDWSCTLEASQEFANGEFTDDIAYTSDNDILVNNSVYKQIEIGIADNDNSLVLSAIETQDFTTTLWTRSTLWCLNYATSTKLTIGQLLARTIMAFQREAIKTYQGTLYFGNTFSMLNSVGYDGGFFFINSGEFDYKTSEFNGDFIKLIELSDITVGTTQPRRSAIDRLRGQVQDLVRDTGDINTRAGNVDVTLRDLRSRITNIENILALAQSSIGATMEFTVTPSPGELIPLNIVFNSDGSYQIVGG